jgi:phosphatidylserine decarboxylase
MNYILESGYLFPSTILFLILSIYYKLVLLTIIIFIFLIFLFYFFRDIDYQITTNNNQINSPCEGTVLNINKTDDLIHLAVFLSPFNIHIQYTPCSGKIIKQVYKPGEFNMAHLFEKSNYNERMETTIKNKIFGDVKIYQIAGLLARSIVSFYKKDDELNQSVPFGLIRLGSRVDIIVKNNPKYKVQIKSGDKIKIGQPLVTINQLIN